MAAENTHYCRSSTLSVHTEMWLRILKAISNGKPVTIEDLRGIDTGRFCSEMVKWGVASLLYPLLTKKDAIPGMIVETAHGSYEAALIYKEFAILLLKNLQERICNSGRVVLVQGMGLIHDLYPEPLLRTMGDIDLYLPDGNIDPICRALKDYGFSRYGGYETVWQYKGLHLDLHTDLWGADRVNGRVKFASCGTNAIRESRLVQGYHVLAPAEMGLHTAFHAVKHAFTRKLWLIDLVFLYRAGYLLSAMEMDRQNVVSAAIEQLKRHGLIKEHNHTNEYGKGLSIRRRILNAAIANGSRSGMGEVALAFCCKSWYETVKYLVSSMLLTRQTLRQMYGNHAKVILFLKRLRSLAKMAGVLP